jgi:glycosyltransferase involved in cell wall biosynthesis
MPERVKVLVVGQTPPPYHGQAIMIERLLRGRFARTELIHVRMAFSESMGDVGRFRLGKLFHLMVVIARIVYCRFVHKPTVLCYPPAGPHRVPLNRDLAILLCTRWMFRHTILYFHAGGISELYPELSAPMRWLFRTALFGADAAIRISNGSPNESRVLQSRHDYIVPNGIEDEFERFAEQRSARHRQRQPAACAGATSSTTESFQPTPADVRTNWMASTLVDEIVPTESPALRILFVGMLSESKGLLVLIEACKLLSAREVPFELHVVGQFVSAEFEDKVRCRIVQWNLGGRIRFLETLVGDAKWAAFARADVLCLPTFYEAETFGLVLVEAMSFELPVVTTRWRGIPEIVDDGETGFLVEIRDSAAVADRLQQLHTDADLRGSLGHAGRAKFLREFTAERYWQRMEKIFIETVESSNRSNSV